VLPLCVVLALLRWRSSYTGHTAGVQLGCRTPMLKLWRPSLRLLVKWSGTVCFVAGTAPDVGQQFSAMLGGGALQPADGGAGGVPQAEIGKSQLTWPFTPFYNLHRVWQPDACSAGPAFAGA